MKSLALPVRALAAAALVGPALVLMAPVASATPVYPPSVSPSETAVPAPTPEVGGVVETATPSSHPKTSNVEVAGATLPKTGGGDALGWAVGGSVLVAGGAALVVATRRRGEA